jgi:hypothetical protein
MCVVGLFFFFFAFYLCVFCLQYNDIALCLHTMDSLPRAGVGEQARAPIRSMPAPAHGSESLPRAGAGK